MQIFSSRGCVYKVAGKGGTSNGMISLNPSLGNGQGRYPILLMSVTSDENDLIAPMPCFDNQNIMYVFGRDIGDVQINGKILMGPMRGGGSPGLGQLKGYFKTNRLSNSKRPITVSQGPGSGAIKMFLTGLGVGEIDPNLHVLPFVLRGFQWDNAQVGGGIVFTGDDI